MEFGIKGTSRVLRGRHGEVGIVESGLYCSSFSDSRSRRRGAHQTHPVISAVLASRHRSTARPPALGALVPSLCPRPPTNWNAVSLTRLVGGRRWTLVFWTRKRVHNDYERRSCSCCWGSCCYRIFDSLRLCRFSTDRNQTFHIY